MDQLIDRSKIKGVHWVPLVDIGIATGTEAETLGNKFDIFLKSAVYNDTKKKHFFKFRRMCMAWCCCFP